MAGAAILHVDLDAFYASVEQLNDPRLRGRPVAVGGGVVLACSYEAKAFGVSSGMSASVALRRCPTLEIVEGHFEQYRNKSDAVFAICEDFTPVVERISIDEAFLDVSGSIHLFGPAETIAAEIRRRVREETGLPISAGVARTKFLAKIASQVAKPDGMVVVQPDREIEFLHPLPVRLMWGVGKVTEERLLALGVRTIGDLADLSDRQSRRKLGPASGSQLLALAWNRDPRQVTRHRRARSLSAQSATRILDRDPAAIDRTLQYLADRVGSRLRSKGIAGRTVTGRVRLAEMRSLSRAATLPQPTASTAAIYRLAAALVGEALEAAPGEGITLLGVAVSKLTDEATVQLELPLWRGSDTRAGSAAAVARASLESSLDQVRDRFGKKAVGVAAVLLSGDRAVPDGFRELAERP